MLTNLGFSTFKYCTLCITSRAKNAGLAQNVRQKWDDLYRLPARIQARISYPDGTSHLERIDKKGCVHKLFGWPCAEEALTAVIFTKGERMG